MNVALTKMTMAGKPLQYAKGVPMVEPRIPTLKPLPLANLKASRETWLQKVINFWRTK